MFKILSVVLLVLFVSGCVDDPNKIANKGGVISKEKSYSFSVMQIDNIYSTGISTKASYCIPNTIKCWGFIYSDDLSDYEDGSLVNIEIVKGKVDNINPVLFTTKLGYYAAKYAFGHNTSTYVAKYIISPFFVLLVFFIIAKKFWQSFDNKRQDVFNSHKRDDLDEKANNK